MALKSKHAFGMLENIDNAVAEGKIDNYDILFVKDALGKPSIGWIDKDGQKVIVDNKADLSGVEAELAKKANAADVVELESQIATKVSTEDLHDKISTAVTDGVATAKSYTDGKVKAAIGEHLAKIFEVTDVPVGTLIKMNESEIRIMCPSNTEWIKQSVGAGGDANCYYVTLKTYVLDDNVTGYIEHLGTQSDAEILTAFSTDEYGRRYQTTWLAVAKYDETAGVWTYYGKNSSVSKYIGWDYQIDWYNADGLMIASDNVRINLSNEQCHSSIEPYYVSGIMAEVDTRINTQIEEKLSEAESFYEIIEF